MNRLEKRDFVKKFSEVYSRHSCMIVVRQVGLSAGVVSQLRRDAHGNNIIFQVVKNSLAKRFLNETYQEISEKFIGPVGVFFSQDPVGVSKLVAEFSKKREDNFFPIVGILDGSILTQSDIKMLATLPTLGQLRGQIAGLLNSVASKMVATLQEPSRCLLRLSSEYSQKH